MTDQENDIRLLDQAAHKLSEHFDAVQIFATRHEPNQLDATTRVCSGVGNWFARYGQIREWMIREEESSRQIARKDSEEI